MQNLNPRPSWDILSEKVAPALWQEAERQAQRSPLGTFRTGAIIHSMGKVVGKGCSHPSMLLTGRDFVHAELHASLRVRPIRGQRRECVVVTLTKTDSWATTSRPCAMCARALNGLVDLVHYAVKDNIGEWCVESVAPADLVARSGPLSSYAREMRIPD